MSGAEVALAAGKVLFSKIPNDFIFKWKLDKSLLDELEMQFNSTKALLNVGEARRMEVDPNFNKWYQKAQYAVLDAEDLLRIIFTDINKENYRLDESSRTIDVIKEKFKYKGKDIGRSIHPYKSTREAEMREAIKKLQLIEAQAILHGVDKNDKLTTFRENRMSTSSDTNPSRIIGRSENEKEILQLLNSREGSDDPLRIIPIIGMGGVGKTTLASMVYNGSEISDQLYEVKGWVCVSYKFEFIHVIKSLLESIKRYSETSVNLEFLQKELKSLLQGKRFLLVLDDVWSDVNEDKWETLRTIFSAGAPGSRILVTTREEKVVYIVSNSLESSYKLNGLSDAEGWSLFQSHAFQNGDSTAYPNLEKIGKDLVGKCKGSPLALKMLGRLLLSEENDETEWNYALHSKVWNVTKKILPSLWLSYYPLSFPVKQCFAYLSIFPKDHIYSMDEMVNFWVAEGLIEKPPQSSNGIYDYEHVGRTYFKHLISNFFIQKNSIDGSGFVMHDLIHDLAEYVSKDLLVNLTDINIESRRLSFIPDQKFLSQLRSVSKLSRLRTFLASDTSSYGPFDLRQFKVSDKLLSNFKYLRVLSLENYCIFTVPTSIGDMKLLSYLNLAGTKIEYLPEWISRLYNLQFLQLSFCWRLKRLPANLFDLVNLRHLIVECLELTEMPDGIGRLTNLRTLSNYVVGKDKSKQMRDFKRLPNLQGNLMISGLNNVDDIEDVVTASFGDMEYIEDLVLEWETIEGRDMKLDERLLDAIQPHNNLKELSIVNYGGKRLSNWIVKVSPSFTGIVSLSITGCCNCEFLPPLGNLRFLKDLHIRGLDSLIVMGVEFYGDGDTPFPALEYLSISYMKSLKKWYFPGGDREGFLLLKKLYISTCPELTTCPYCFRSLIELQILGCFNLVGLEMHDTVQKVSATSLRTYGHSLQSLFISQCPKLEVIPKYFLNLLELTIKECENMMSELQEVKNELCINVTETSLDIRTGQFTALEGLDGDMPYPRISSKIDKDDDDDEDIHELKYDDHVLRLPNSDIRTSIITQMICNLHFLKKLTISVRDFPNSFMDVVLPSTLDSLIFDNCLSLITIPSQLLSGCRKRLEVLKLLSCTNLACLPDVIQALESLQRLILERCPLIKHFPTSSGLLFSSLCNLDVSRCPALESLPENFHDITTLRTLTIKECPNLITPRDGLPTMISILVIKNCGKMEPVSNMKLSRLTSLIHLELEGFPETSRLDDCNPDSIETLIIVNFPRLKSLSRVPLSRVPPYTYVVDCPLLKRDKSWPITKRKSLYIKF